MQCLNKCQMMLYLSQFGYTKEEKDKMKSHIDSCEACQAFRDRIAHQLSEALVRSRNQCQWVQNHLTDYLDSELDSSETNRVTQHVKQCEVCHYYLKHAEQTFAEMKLDQATEEVPDAVTSRLKKAIHKIQKQMKHSENFQKHMGAIQRLFHDLSEYIELQLTPVQLAFRGKTHLFEKEIEHTGGHLVVNIQDSDRIMRIRSSDDLELFQGKSDESGFVIFQELLPGTYKIIVEGYEIDSVRRVKL